MEYLSTFEKSKVKYYLTKLENLEKYNNTPLLEKSKNTQVTYSKEYWFKNLSWTKQNL